MTSNGGYTPLPTDLTPAVLQGHVLDVLRSIPEGSVQCVVTSPPYWGLRVYGTAPQVWGGDQLHAHDWSETAPRRDRYVGDQGAGSIQARSEGPSYEAQGGAACSCGAWRGELGLEPSPDLFVSHLADVFDEVRRVLRSDGTLWLNLGDTYHTDSPVRRSGAENFSKEWDPAQTASRGGPRRSNAREGDLKPKDLVGIPWMVAFELRRRGWWLRSDSIWAKRNCMPESVKDRPTRSHEYVFLLTKGSDYYYDPVAVSTPLASSTRSRAKNHYSNPRDNPDPDSKWGAVDSRSYPLIGRHKRPLDGQLRANLKSVWWITTQPYPEAHFATFPEEIAETAILAGTSEKGACASCGSPYEREIESRTFYTSGSGLAGKTPEEVNGSGKWTGAPTGVHVKLGPRVETTTLGWTKSCACEAPESIPCLVLDPFCGSGTSLWVARSNGRRALGIELNPEYVELARRRAKAWAPALERYAEGATA